MTIKKILFVLTIMLFSICAMGIPKDTIRPQTTFSLSLGELLSVSLSETDFDYILPKTASSVILQLREDTANNIIVDKYKLVAVLENLFSGLHGTGSVYKKGNDYYILVESQELYSNILIVFIIDKDLQITKVIFK